MIRQGLIEQEVLHEIAMSIGESIEMENMLAECIPVFLRGLGCATAAVLLRDEQDEFYTPTYILPRAAVRNHHLHQAINRSVECLTVHEPLPVPLCHFESTGLYYYAWPVQDFGALLLGRSTQFRDGLLREIQPLVNKLALALVSCRQYQRLKLAQQSMIQARDEAQAANKAKSHFLATMSHEIRTPLNAVINLSELLLETKLDDRQRKLIQGVCEGGRSLLQLVNDVLDFSRIEAGRLELVTTSFRLHDLLDGLASLFEKDAALKKLYFGLSIGDDVPEVIAADPSRLRQILQNLLANAIKFTEKGSVSVTVKMLPKEQQRAGNVPMMIFHISDTGIGISEQDQQRLFQEFSQVDTNLDRRFGGSGLGLAIAARLVMLMGGKIGCHSVPGVGSTFWFTLPVRTNGTVHEQSRTDSSGLQPVNVLLVEDSQTNQMVATAMLEKTGCRLTIANNGYESLEKVQQADFDIVLMDVSMPGMDGLEATRRIRALGGKYQTLPILAMTAHAFAHDREACLEAGMNDYLSKPLQREQLYSLLKKWTLSKDTGTVTETLPPPVTMIGTTKPILDEHIIQTLLNDISPDLFRQLVIIFLQESREHFDAMAQLIPQGDSAAAAKRAHAVKSSAGALGAVALQDMCGQLEIACRESKPHIAALLQATTNVAEASWQALHSRLG
ncbi:response regulator [Tolumonas osonensis]|uniref:Sensory/regulatory protein RpfC n=1 Tax=Tolumonas osonensis TaxID=675874 RepID=A0A841GGB0_9GAMM|nr:signal transduction histidine kinase/HPt (histidine-containing phosphotransfer) domain-containing protein [Tolumonas osonensis]